MSRLYLKEDVSKAILEKKQKLKVLYLKYHNIFDSRMYSCGKQLAEYITPELGQIKQEFNKIAGELKELDPTCPKNMEL